MDKVSALFRSNVLKNDDYLWEIISAQVYVSKKQGKYFSIVACREAEIQCFNVDENEKTFFEPSDWYYRLVDFSPKSTKETTKLINSITLDIAQDHGATDVPSNSSIVTGFRNVYTHPLAAVQVLGGINVNKVHLVDFWDKLVEMIPNHIYEGSQLLLDVFPEIDPKIIHTADRDSRQYNDWASFS